MRRLVVITGVLVFVHYIAIRGFLQNHNQEYHHIFFSINMCLELSVMLKVIGQFLLSKDHHIHFENFQICFDILILFLHFSKIYIFHTSFYSIQSLYLALFIIRLSLHYYE